MEAYVQKQIEKLPTIRRFLEKSQQQPSEVKKTKGNIKIATISGKTVLEEARTKWQITKNIFGLGPY